MTRTIPIRHLLSLRPDVSDQVLLDYLELLFVLAWEPGQVLTQQLQERWSCAQCTVSRRLNAVNAAGLAEITPGWGAYQVHSVKRLEPAA